MALSIPDRALFIFFDVPVNGHKEKKRQRGIPCLLRELCVLLFYGSGNHFLDFFYDLRIGKCHYVADITFVGDGAEHPSHNLT